jgi:hypothetical protein
MGQWLGTLQRQSYNCWWGISFASMVANTLQEYWKLNKL